MSTEPNSPAEKAKLLIADDDPDARALIELAFISEPYELFIYEDGSQAIEAFPEVKPDLVILDVQMPGASGIQVCSWIKGLNDSNFTPVMLVTSQSELVHKVEGLNCGADDYVTKPYDFPELLARAQALLRIKVLTNHLRQTQAILADKEKQLIAAEVAGAAAHELGQPLTAMLLNCQLLSQFVSNSDKAQEITIRIEEQCNTMRNILNKLNQLDSYKTTDYIGDVKIVDLGISEKE